MKQKWLEMKWFSPEETQLFFVKCANEGNLHGKGMSTKCGERVFCQKMETKRTAGER